jgi:hypothetical protein
MGFDPAINGQGQKVAALAVVQHGESLLAAVAAVGGAENLQGQAVQGTHVEADGGQVPLSEPLPDAGLEGIDAGVEVGDDEDLLVGLGINTAVFNQLCRQQGEGKGLAAPRHGADG